MLTIVKRTKTLYPDLAYSKAAHLHLQTTTATERRLTKFDNRKVSLSLILV